MASAVVKTDLHTFSTGWPTATSFKKDDNWIFNPDPDNLPIDSIKTDNKRRLEGRPFYYEDITYTDYKLEDASNMIHLKVFPRLIKLNQKQEYLQRLTML